MSSKQVLAAGALAGAVVYFKADKKKLLKAILAGSTAAIVNALSQVLSRSLLGLKREPYPIQEWAEQNEEDAVEPELAILDAHHHLWDARPSSKQDKALVFGIPSWGLSLLYMLKPRVWMNMLNNDASLKALGNSFGYRQPSIMPFMGAELSHDIHGNGRGHKVVGTIFMECGWKTPGVEPCMEPVKEADMVTEVNRCFPNLCQGIIAFADLRLGAAIEPALQYYKKNPLVKGIRHGLAYVDDPSIFPASHCDMSTGFDSKFREGFALLSKYGFTFDSWLYHVNLPALTDLAKNFPETTIICDHMAYPLGIGNYNRAEVFPEWKKSMTALAEHKNVFVKTGGFGMRFPGFGFDERPTPPSSDELCEAWGPYVKFTIETFGVDRCIMESNFPMDKVTCNYTVYFNAMKKIVRSYSVEDKRKLFELNARRVYGL